MSKSAYTQPGVDYSTIDSLESLVQERGGSRFGTLTDGQGNSVSSCHVHPASGTAAGGTFTTGPAGPVRSVLRTPCMETVALPMVEKG